MRWAKDNNNKLVYPSASEFAGIVSSSSNVKNNLRNLNFNLCFYIEKDLMKGEIFKAGCLPANDNYNRNNVVKKIISRAEGARSMGQNTNGIFLNISKRYNPSMQKFIAFDFPNYTRVHSFFNELSNKTIYCVLSLKDKDGNEIVISKEKCHKALFYSNVISPEFSTYRGFYCDSDGVVFSFDMDKEDLKDVKSMEVKLETK
ncbi:MAG: hypothetical protein IJS08_13895 [Victivallales bacterium]|nr:hypothetical protein [Victivallales bacterium]